MDPSETSLSGYHSTDSTECCDTPLLPNSSFISSKTGYPNDLVLRIFIMIEAYSFVDIRAIV